MEKPLVSIIIPTYNRSEFLKGAIESALSQSYKNLELIIWDDGSTDNTKDVVASFFDSRIKYFYEKNHGRSYALNKAVNLINGKFTAFLDDDDTWFKHKIEKQVSTMLTYTNIDILFSNFINKNQITGEVSFGFDGTIKSLNVNELEQGLFLIRKGIPSILLGNYIQFDSVIIKSFILKNHQPLWKEDLRNSADSIIWLKLFYLGYNFAFHQEKLMIRNKNDSSLSKSSEVQKINVLKAADYCLEVIEEFNASEDIVYVNEYYLRAYLGLLKIYAKNGESIKAFRAFCIAIKYGFHIRLIFYLFYSFLNSCKLKLTP